MNSLGLEPLAGVRTAGISQQTGIIEPIVAEQFAIPEKLKEDSFIRRKPAIFSRPTATYDRKGTYPAMRIFQIAKPLPEQKPFGALVKDISSGGNRYFISNSYLKRSSQGGNFIDSKV